SSSDGISLNLLSGRECPAGSAVSLIFDCSGQHTSPVLQALVDHRLRGRNVEHTLRVSLSHGGISSQQASLKLNLTQVREFGDAVHSTSTSLLLLSVSLVRNLQVLDKGVKSLGLLLHGVVLLSMFHFEGLKQRFLRR